MKKVILGIESVIKHILSALILAIRPIMGCPGCCRYPISCTDYALFMLEHKRLLPALNLIIRRVLSCNPFTKPLRQAQDEWSLK
jgi:putative component of membrane protein insertase Oxa1/YidC/SpoIIIJ protein YidD